MKKILVIEDEDSIRENIFDALSLNGYEIYTAENGLDGLNKAIQIIPDLVICDIMMPLMDGYEVLSIIKEEEKLMLTPLFSSQQKANTRM
jgi:CheY-like chemotaxis protein